MGRRAVDPTSILNVLHSGAVGSVVGWLAETACSILCCTGLVLLDEYERKAGQFRRPLLQALRVVLAVSLEFF